MFNYVSLSMYFRKALLQLDAHILCVCYNVCITIMYA